MAAIVTFATPAIARTASQPTPQSQHQAIRRIVVSIPDRKLALIENDRVVKVYPAAVGAPESPSPTGEFQIVQRLSNPTYYKPGVVIGPGASNPLGSRWMGLDVKGFGIHGTNRPGSIGKNTSHGCIRLGKVDIEDLFDRVRAGDRVSLIGERNEEVARIFGGRQIPATSADESQVARTESDSEAQGARGERYNEFPQLNKGESTWKQSLDSRD